MNDRGRLGELVEAAKHPDARSKVGLMGVTNYQFCVSIISDLS